MKLRRPFPTSIKASLRDKCKILLSSLRDRKNLSTGIRSGFTFVEILVVMTILTLILLTVYRFFSAQVRVVSTSMEIMKVNDDFRKIHSYLNNDIHEATMITYPAPIELKETETLVTPKPPCVVLQLVKQQLNPKAPYSRPPLDKITASSTYGQISRVIEVVYELRPTKKANEDENQQDTSVPRFKLFRTELIRESANPNLVVKSEKEITDTIRDLVIFRTIRKAAIRQSIQQKDDRLIELESSNNSGTGNNLVHLRVTLERRRGRKTGDVYDITLTTCYYKRGREVFYYQ